MRRQNIFVSSQDIVCLLKSEPIVACKASGSLMMGRWEGTVVLCNEESSKQLRMRHTWSKSSVREKRDRGVEGAWENKLRGQHHMP